MTSTRYSNGRDYLDLAFFRAASACFLEIGGGTRDHVLELKRRGFDDTAIEIADSSYALNRQFPIIEANISRLAATCGTTHKASSAVTISSVPGCSAGASSQYLEKRFSYASNIIFAGGSSLLVKIAARICSKSAYHDTASASKSPSPKLKPRD